MRWLSGTQAMILTDFYSLNLDLCQFWLVNWRRWNSKIYYRWIHLLIFCFQNSFADIARVLSEFFRDLDVVPSDVIVGLVLLRKRQQLLRLRTIHQVTFFIKNVFSVIIWFLFMFVFCFCCMRWGLEYKKQTTLILKVITFCSQEKKEVDLLFINFNTMDEKWMKKVSKVRILSSTIFILFFVPCKFLAILFY